MSVPGDRAASELNRELTGLLAEAGRKLGFDVVLEYPVRGGRLDVVWSWSPTSPFPGLERPVPVVGFEIESSWRTRKHIKGDLLNLQDAGVGLSVIVLAGTDPKDDGLRRSAELLVDRPGPTVLVWTADDVRALAEQRSTVPALPLDSTEAVGDPAAQEQPEAPLTPRSGAAGPRRHVRAAAPVASYAGRHDTGAHVQGGRGGARVPIVELVPPARSALARLRCRSRDRGRRMEGQSGSPGVGGGHARQKDVGESWRCMSSSAYARGAPAPRRGTPARSRARRTAVCDRSVSSASSRNDSPRP